MCVQSQQSLWRSLAVSLRFSDWRTARMAVMTTYIDASGGSAEVVVAPAALTASPEIWEEFDRRWSACLAQFNISALHMKEFAHFKGEFESWKFETSKRSRLLNHLLWIIEDLVEYTTACAVYFDDYRYMDRNYRLSESMRPYTMGCLTCASAVVVEGKSRGWNKNDLIWVIEKGDEDQGDLRKHWDIAYPDQAVSPIFLKKRDKYPDQKECRPIRPFEAADLLAYEHLQVHRLLDRRQGSDVFEDELRRPMQRMKNWPSVREWKVCDHEAIERLCATFRIPARVIP
jgi:hypothetical protein